MADNVSPLNFTANEPVSPPELDARNDQYGLQQGKLLYEAQIQKLMNALDRRRQMPFDPMWMRVAAGFLKPTKTGSFGESLGYAAEGAAEEAEKEAARKTDVEKLKMELAGKQYELAQQYAGQRMLGESLTGKSGAPMPEPTDGMTTDQVVSIVKKNPNALDKITLNPERVAAISSISPAYGKIAENLFKNQVEQAKLEMSRYDVNAQGDTIDKATGEIIKYGSRMVEVASPFDPDVKMPIRAADLDSYSKLDFSNPAEVNKWMKSKGLGAYAIGKEAKPTAEESPTGAPTTETEGKTKSQRETEKVIREKRAESDIKRDEEDKTKIYASQTNAVENLRPNASSILRYATNPATSKAFGYLSKKGVGNAIASLVENGVTIGNWRIGLTDVGDALRKVDPNISQQDIEALQAVAQNMARLELGFSTAFKGQGQVSDFERKIVQSIGPQKSDTARVAALKSELILARAKMDELTAEAYNDWSSKNPNGYVTDFRNKNAEYKKLVRQYNAKLEQIQKKYGFE